jgi:hypothetical protein
MKNSYRIKGTKAIIWNWFGHVHMDDYDGPTTRLMWITARSQRHADRLKKILRWHNDRRPGFSRETYYDYRKKQLVSRVVFS